VIARGRCPTGGNDNFGRNANSNAKDGAWGMVYGIWYMVGAIRWTAANTWPISNPLSKCIESERRHQRKRGPKGAMY